MTSKYLLCLSVAILLTSAVVGQNELQIPVENDNQFPPEKQQQSDTVFEGSGQAVLEVPITTTTASDFLTTAILSEAVATTISSEPVSTATSSEPVATTISSEPVTTATSSEPVSTTTSSEPSATTLAEQLTTKETEDTTTTTEAAPILEEVQPQSAIIDQKSEMADDPCPKPCVCNTEGDDFVVNCAGYEISEFPLSLDAKTTKLFLQNNKLANIPRQISVLKNLKELNLENNAIMELASGSISELPELTLLNLRNNRLIEYPQDLKNSFALTKLREIDLGGNDMRTELTPEVFVNFNSLRKVILPTSTTELVENLCESLSLETVCTHSCDIQYKDCFETRPDVLINSEEAVLPGVLYVSQENEDPVIDPENNSYSTSGKPKLTDITVTEVTNSEANEFTTVYPHSNVKLNSRMVNEFSLRTEVDKVPSGEPQLNSAVITTDKSEAEVNVGATTSANSGGVDKSVIGLIVAGMVVIVAGITIKKNWTSIKKRFSSTPARNVGEHTVANGNGTTPEEVPLKDKSPV